MQNNLSPNTLNKRDIKAFLFDMDGILFDSMPYHAMAWQKAMSDFNLNFSLYESYKNEGRTGDSTIEEVFMQEKGYIPDVNTKQQIYKRKTEYFNQNHIIKRIDGVLDVLKMLKAKNLQILLVTGSAQTSLIENINNYFPGIFQKDKIITAFDVTFGKPHPEPYLLALQKANVKAEEAIVIENAPLGVRSGVAAGIFTIGVNTGILLPDDLKNEGANIVVDNMKELAVLLKSII